MEINATKRILPYSLTKDNLDVLLNVSKNLVFIQSDKAKEMFLCLQNEDFNVENTTEENLIMLENLAKMANSVLADTNISVYLPAYIILALENVKNKLTKEKLFELSGKK